jgi:hypothetical protein
MPRFRLHPLEMVADLLAFMHHLARDLQV